MTATVTRRPAPAPSTLHRRRLAVRALVVLSAIGGALAGAHPTGLDVLDPLLTALVAALVTGFSSKARRWSWATASGIALVAASQETAIFIVAFVVFAAAVATSVLDLRNRVVGAALGLVIVQILLRLPEWGPFGTQSLIAFVAMAVLIGSGFRNARRTTRRRAVLVALVVAGLALVLTALFGVAVLQTRDDLDAGIAATKRGITAARSGDTTAAAAAFDEARGFLSSAADTLDAPWSRAARVVPVVGQHEDALRTLTLDAQDLTATGATAAREADVETLRVEDGRIDLARVDEMRAPLQRVDAALDDAQRDLADVDSGWLLPPAADRLDELDERVDKAAGSARTAALGIDAAPTLLGGTEPARYLLLFTTPSEARSTGFPGNYGILTVTDGQLDLTEFGRITDLNRVGDPGARTLEGPADYIERYGRFRPEVDLRSLTMSPDFPSVAEVARGLTEQVGLGPIDGVIAIDPEGVAALLQLTGPVAVPGRTEPLTADNAAEFLLRGQYEDFARPERIDYLEEAARAVTEELTTGSLPGPRAIGDALGPAAKGGHLLLASFDPTADALFERLGVRGELAPTEGDYVALTTQNASGNKIELFLQRTLRYEATIDPVRGTERATATITLTNTAPTSGEPPIVIASPNAAVGTGNNRSILSFYTYLGLASATLDGQPVELRGQLERDVNVFTTGVTIPSGATVTLVLELEGEARLAEVDDDVGVRLTLGHQVMPNPDRVEVALRPAGGVSFDGRPPLRTTPSGVLRWTDDAFTERQVLDALIDG